MKDPALGKKVRIMREQLGSIIGPMEGWLMMRGLRTLEVRVKEHAKTALAIAQYLEGHTKVRKVYYTGLASHPQRELIIKQQSGHTGLLSFELESTTEQAKHLSGVENIQDRRIMGRIRKPGDNALCTGDRRKRPEDGSRTKCDPNPLWTGGDKGFNG